MRKTLFVYFALSALFILAFPADTAAQNDFPDSGQPQLTASSTSPLAINQGYVPPKNPPPLPPGQKQPKELPPTIQVTRPAVGPNLRVCEKENVELQWNYFGDIGGTVNVKIGTFFPISVPVQGGQGSYTWKAIGQGKGGYALYNVIVTAGNGKATGTGGKIEVFGPEDKHCGDGSYAGK